MEDIQLLTDLANGMAPGKTICALSDAAAIPTHSVVRQLQATSSKLYVQRRRSRGRPQEPARKLRWSGRKNWEHGA